MFDLQEEDSAEPQSIQIFESERTHCVTANALTPTSSGTPYQANIIISVAHLDDELGYEEDDSNTLQPSE